MPTDSWINESLYPDWGQRFLVTRELARVKSDFQDIVIFESTSHGRVMVLDGVIQITEGDEFVYQEMLAHVPLLAHGSAENVLIIGAGDGGVLRRVLPQWCSPSHTAWAVFPGRKLMPAKTRVFIDMLQAALGGIENAAP